MKYPIYILVAGYLISLSCIYVYSTPFIHDTFIGNIWIAIFGEGDQLFFVAFTFFVRESIKILSSESSISLILKLRTPETLMRQGFIRFSDIRQHHIMHTVSGTFPIDPAVLP